MGSKDSIVHKVCSVFPPADNFYDLFGGGFSVSHYMLLHRANRYNHFLFNEPAPGTVDLIRDAISGKFNYNTFKPPFIGREEFFKNKDSCAYTRIIWSFGNNQSGYIFGKDIESYKKSLHDAVIFDSFDTTAIKALGICKWPLNSTIKARRFFIRRVVKKRMGELQQLELLERLERLEQLEQLERLERLERLELTSIDYRKVEIKPNSVVYCDPPYEGTAEYTEPFDHAVFWDWVRKNEEPVFVSEYTAPKDIGIVMAIRKKSKLAARSPIDSVEKIFGNKAAIERIRNH